LWRYFNKFHRVPEGFEFPSYNVTTMWGLWFFGNERAGICPYRLISAKCDLVRPVDVVNHSRCKRVMNALVKIAIQGGKIQSAREITLQNSQDILNYSYHILLNSVYEKFPSKPASININTLANRIPTKKGIN